MRRSDFRMKLFGATLAAGLLPLTACTGGNSEDSGSSGADEGLPSATFTETGDSSEASGETSSTSSSTMTGDGDGDGDGDTGGAVGDPCESDDDCGEGLECGPNDTCQFECGDVEVTLEATPPPVMLVLDKSGSMVSNSWDHDGDPGTAVETRWATLHRVVTFVLTNFENGIDFGAQLFPSTGACPNGAGNCYNSGACVVNSTPEVNVQGSAQAAILAAIPPAGAGSSQIQGGTPAADGIRSAVTALNGLSLPDDTTPAIIFVTDGAANCGQGLACTGLTDCPLLENYDNDLPTVVGDAFNNDGIPTYVIGIDIQDALLGSGNGNGTPEANPYVELNAVAVAGGVARPGTDKFYNATNEAELQAALDEIVGVVATCEIDLTMPPNMPPDQTQVDQDLVKFNIGGMDVPRLDVDQATCESGSVDGWIWLVEGEQVLFCGTFCDQMKSTGQVDGDYLCPGAG